MKLTYYLPPTKSNYKVGKAMYANKNTVVLHCRVNILQMMISLFVNILTFFLLEELTLTIKLERWRSLINHFCHFSIASECRDRAVSCIGIKFWCCQNVGSNPSLAGAALVSLSKTLNHNCFVLRMGRKAAGLVCCVMHVKEPRQWGSGVLA